MLVLTCPIRPARPRREIIDTRTGNLNLLPRGRKGTGVGGWKLPHGFEWNANHGNMPFRTDRDPMGRVTGIRRVGRELQQGGTVGIENWLERSLANTYNGLGQLTRSTSEGSAAFDEEYVYSATANNARITHKKDYAAVGGTEIVDSDCATGWGWFAYGPIPMLCSRRRRPGGHAGCRLR